MTTEKDIFKQILIGKPSWKNLADTEFVDILAAYVGNRGDASKMYAERMSQEFFGSTALNRESILAKAEFDGYVPALPSPFSQYLIVTNAGSNSLPLFAKQAFVTDGGVHMIIEESVTIEPGVTTSLQAKQLSKKVKDFVSTGIPFEEFIIGGTDEEGIFSIHSFDIYVNGDLWEESEMFRNADKDSEVYITFYRLSDELAIRLGNGDTGKLPAAESTIQAEIWYTQGERAEVISGIELNPVGELLDSTGQPASIIIKSGGVIKLGSPLEDIESIRKSIQSHTQIGEVVARIPFLS